MPVKIAVIIVNYSTPDLAIQAVESVLTCDHKGRPIEIHLIDNASPGDDVAKFQTAAEAWGNRVTLWPETKNHGFGRGNNVVLRSLAARENPPEYVFLLNPDAKLTNEAIHILAETLDAHPEAATAGAGVCNMSATPMSAAFRFPSPIGEILRTINFGPLDWAFGRYRISLPPDHPQGPVDWVAAAAVMFRFEPLHDAGFFDDGFFLYYEEVELMHRLTKNGWTTLYVPTAQVCHIEGAATGGGGLRRDRPAYLYKSWRHYFTVTYGRGPALALALLLLPIAFLNILHLRLRGRTPSVPARFLQDQWRLVIRPLLTGSGS